MNDFTFYNPVRIVFGRESLESLAELVPADRKTMLVYGGGSIKRTGTYDQVMKRLAGRGIVEFGGIEPNPAYETLMDGVALAREEGVEFLLAVGGGSVIDGTKFIAAAALFEGDAWQLLEQRLDPGKAIPFGVVLTLPATGSEMNNIAVISRTSSQEKLAFIGDCVFPAFSVLNPELTFSLPPRQIRNGIVDAFVHVMDQYITYSVNTPLQDRQAEAVPKTLMEVGPVTLANPSDYDSRASLMWCATAALNGNLKCGTVADFATHRIGHELTAFYGVEHAESLAGLMLALWTHQKARKGERLAQYARRVLGVDCPDAAPAAQEAIDGTREFFRDLGMPTSLSELGIDAEDAARRISARCAERGATFGEHDDLQPDDVADLMRLCG